MSSELKNYYEKYFPFVDMYNWLSYGDSTYFYNREFSLTINDVYLRYRSFKNAIEYKKSVVEKVPNKIDIGPVYTTSVLFSLNKACSTKYS
jgi:DNA primase small subunit